MESGQGLERKESESKELRGLSFQNGEIQTKYSVCTYVCVCVCVCVCMCVRVSMWFPSGIRLIILVIGLLYDKSHV